MRNNGAVWCHKQSRTFYRRKRNPTIDCSTSNTGSKPGSNLRALHSPSWRCNCSSEGVPARVIIGRQKFRWDIVNAQFVNKDRSAYTAGKTGHHDRWNTGIALMTKQNPFRPRRFHSKAKLTESVYRKVRSS